MKDNKGMTLVEVMISLLIISTASIMMVYGFVTAVNLFNSSNEYKDVANNEENALLDGSDSSSVNIDSSDAKYAITVNDGDTPIEVNGELKKATDSKNKDVTLSYFEKNEFNNTNKGKTVYRKYCNMMESLYAYLKEKQVSSGSKLVYATVKTEIASWGSKMTGGEINTDIFSSMPELYKNVYKKDTELDSLLETVGNTNNQFGQIEKDRYKYIYPCIYMSDTKKKSITVKEFFEEKGYKDYVYILASENANNPSTIWTLYDNKSSTKKVDTWLIPQTSMATDILIDKKYDEINDLAKNQNWNFYTMKK